MEGHPPSNSAWPSASDHGGLNGDGFGRGPWPQQSGMDIPQNQVGGSCKTEGCRRMPDRRGREVSSRFSGRHEVNPWGNIIRPPGHSVRSQSNLGTLGFQLSQEFIEPVLPPGPQVQHSLG